MTKPIHIEITDHGYKTNNHKVLIKGTKYLVLDLAKSHGWYDFSVKVTGSKSFTGISLWRREDISIKR
jgi:phospholipase C